MVDAVWLIPAFPLVGFLALLVVGKRLGDPKAGYLATGAIAASFVTTLLVFFDLLGKTGEERHHVVTLFTWIPAGGLHLDAGFLVDPLSITMALFVTGVGSLIHLYAVGYMHGDDRFPKFFVYLNLFAFSMLMLVLADNFLVTFLGWEGVGACSYFLISFWFERDTASSAGVKAFVTNRVGDFGFMVAMFLIFATLGSLQYTTVMAEADTLSRTTATAIALLLFVGACGKSAQLPLYVWLPDAMEGPTPVSALIHAATMVTAGVFLMVRINPILDLAPTALTIIAIVGAATAFFAATIACAQADIKKVLAYSTISQLGYMFLAVGSGAYVAAIFHMVTHAFFKALLFLGAGSVIHGLHDEQDMNRMGALRKLLPVTSMTFIAGWLAIAGVFPFAGFWSKDEILAAAWDKSPILWAVGLVTAVLTAYYMSRQVFMVFFGGERFDRHHVHPHESPKIMTVPLMVLAGLAAVGGLINLPFGGYKLEHWLEPVLHHPHELALASSGKLALALIATAGALAGIGIAYLVYLKQQLPRIEPSVLQHAWYVDAFYDNAVAKPGRSFAAFSANTIDAKVIDGAVNGVATVVRTTGGGLRRIQTGFVRNYALAIATGAVGVLAYMLARS